MTPFTFTPGPLAAAYAKTRTQLHDSRFADALWARRLDVWTGDEGTRQKIAQRLGWLDALTFVTPQIDRLRAFADGVRQEGFTDVVLLGMGGSSLAPEVLRQTLGVAPGHPRFRMLDSVDPDAVREALANAATSLFVLASKSGSTIEPNVMAAEAKRRVIAAGHADWGSRFVAITDPGTLLFDRAASETYRERFVNPADIGGRYSALSLFGMVPAALMGADLDRILAEARAMESACRDANVDTNPGLALGAAMAAGARTGRDKLTLLLPPRLHSFGMWVEQLVAESTGKQGKGVVPIAGEQNDVPFGADRLVVAVDLAEERADAGMLARAEQARVPVFSIDMPAVTSIGAEFLRWEVATAAAGLLLGINPFDEPNVQQAKDATRVLLDAYTTRKQLPIPEPHAATGGIRLTLSAAAESQLTGAAATDFLATVKPADYLGLLAYLPPDDRSWGDALAGLRAAVAKRTQVATMFGYGPRYLHSTGQLHKGGANNGVFIVITAEGAEDLAIPGEPFSFSVLEMAQAVGDFQSLDGTGRRALLVRLPRRDPALLRTLGEMLVGPAEAGPHGHGGRP